MDFPNPISGLKTEHRRAAGSSDLYRQGDSPAFFYALRSGWAYRYRLLGDGRRQILGIVLPGDLVGVEALVFPFHDHALRAATDIEVQVIDPARLRVALAEQSGLAYRLLAILAEERSRTDRHLTVVARCAACQALATVVMDLYDRLIRLGMLPTGETTFACPLDQSELADHVGITVVHLNRVLRQMRQRGLLAIRRRLVEISDAAGLRKLSCLQETD